MRILRAGVGLMLVAAGALIYAASWQRWAGACAWGQDGGGACLARQDHLYDFVAPTSPWEPVGNAAQLAGGSLLVAALALALLPWALTGRRPGTVTGVALSGAVLAQVSVGAATLISGLSGEVVRPAIAALAVYLWILWPPALLVRFAIPARGWARAACVFLVLASPLVAALSYAIGPYDAEPWWEATSGTLTVVGGVCLLVAAVRGRQSGCLDQDADAVATPTLAAGAVAFPTLGDGAVAFPTLGDGAVLFPTLGDGAVARE